ncbi:MAG: hypothetical protein A2Y23_13765 [Clostridiales bacterium GWB2_37_7]|nr:MAG: hypothetical protein A2Y23_13765 [Clostridiales bacterium GWB2_37_7]
MNYRIAAKITCRMLAIYFFMLSMNYIPSLLLILVPFSSGFSNFGQSMLLTYSTGILHILTTIFLWVFADKISIAIIKEIPSNNEKSEVDYDKIAIIAFAFAGIFVLTNAIPDMVRMLIQHNILLANQLNYKETSMYAENLSRIISEAVQVGMGFWLILGSKGILRVIKGLRELGLDRIEKIEN